MDETEAIFRAVAAGDLDVVKRILADAPALARARGASSLSVLQFARYAEQTAILEELVAAGPALDIFEAAMIDRAERVRALLDAEPAQAAAYSSYGFTALHFAAYFGALSAMAALIDGGASMEAVTTNFLTNMPIHAAGAGGRRPACALLVERGANVNARQHGGFTALHTAAFRDNRPMAVLFLEAGAEASARNDEGKTAAQVADSMGNMEIAAFIRAREA
ncbi:MAG: ankyrin repeat domain-containing protein [Dehalococcoidia bacterium]